MDDYLGQLELGVSDDEVHTQTRERNGKAEFEVPLVNVGLSGGRATSVAVERNVRQNGASRFARLHKLLLSSDPRELWQLDSIDDATWACLSQGDLVEVEIEVTIPMMVRYLGAANSIGPLMEAASALGTASIDPTMRKKVAAFQEFSATGAGTAVTLLGSASASPEYSFGLRLQNADLLGPLGDLEGRCTVLAQIQTIIQEGDTEVASDIPAMGAMNRAERRKAARGHDGADTGQWITEVHGPGAMLEVVAVYR